VRYQPSWPLHPRHASEMRGVGARDRVALRITVGAAHTCNMESGIEASWLPSSADLHVVRSKLVPDGAPKTDRPCVSTNGVGVLTTVLAQRWGEIRRALSPGWADGYRVRSGPEAVYLLARTAKFPPGGQTWASRGEREWQVELIELWPGIVCSSTNVRKAHPTPISARRPAGSDGSTPLLLGA